jgi:hypothetical protein
MNDVVGHANKTESAVVSAGPGALVGCILTAGADNATLTIYDNKSEGSGTIIVKVAALANTSEPFLPGVKLPVSNGLYATLTGTAPSATVLFTP